MCNLVFSGLNNRIYISLNFYINKLMNLLLFTYINDFVNICEDDSEFSQTSMVCVYFIECFVLIKNLKQALEKYQVQMYNK